MKLLTVSIAAYNVEKYLEQTLLSLNDKRFLEDIEVLIIDDGSSDNTSNIAKKYQSLCPDSFCYIQKQNGGHGSTINKGIEIASGKYFKALDGDDWVDTEAFYIYLEKLKQQDADIVLTPYVTVSGEKRRLVNTHQDLEEGEIYDMTNTFDTYQIVFHEITVRTQLLRRHKIKITENCFYVDTEYVAWALFLSTTLIYFRIPIYMYRIEISEQSVNKKNMVKNIKMLERVSFRLLELYIVFKEKGMTSTKENLIFSEIQKVLGSTVRVFLLFDSLENSRREILQFDDKIKTLSPAIYENLQGDIFFNWLRKFNYSLLPVVRIFYRLWCKQYR